MSEGIFFMVPASIVDDLDNWLKDMGYEIHSNFNEQIEDFSIHVAVQGADIVTIPKFVKKS